MHLVNAICPLVMFCFAGTDGGVSLTVMKRCFIPPLAAVSVVIVSAVLCSCFELLKLEPTGILRTAGFLFFYLLTCASCISQSIKNSDAVGRALSRSPYLVPVIFFSVPVIIMNLYLNGAPAEKLFFHFQMTVCLAAYGICAASCVREFRKGFRAERAGFEAARRNPGTGKRRLVLVNPGQDLRGGLMASDVSRFPPLGLGIIAALTPEDYEVVLIDENYEGFEFTCADLAE